MIVIALYGSANTGKSSTLRLVIEELIKRGCTVNTVVPEGWTQKADVRCCLNTPSEKKICITTFGDDKPNQVKNKQFVHNCGQVDVWITASRNYGDSVDYIL